jgi:hypothetical protein
MAGLAEHYRRVQQDLWQILFDVNRLIGSLTTGDLDAALPLADIARNLQTLMPSLETTQPVSGDACGGE